MEAVNVPINQPGESKQTVVIFGGILVLLLVAAGFYMMWGGGGKPAPGFDISSQLSELESQKIDSNASLITTIVENSDGTITAEEAQAMIDETQSEAADEKKSCGFYPQQGNICRPNFAYDETTGCCNAVADNPPSKAEQGLKLFGELAQGIIITQLAEKMIKFIARRGLLNVLKGSTKIAIKVAINLSGKIGGKIAAKIALKLLAKLATCAAAGPIGWALMAFDILSISIDFLDPLGYDLYTANDVLEKQDKNSMFIMWQQQVLNNAEWPIMIPLTHVYGDLYNDFVISVQQDRYMTPATMAMFEALPDEEVDMLLGLSLDTDEEVDIYYDTFEPFYEEIMNEDTEARDELIFDALQGALKTRQGDIFLCPEMSNRTRIGISLSEDKCNSWNKKHLPVWTWYVNNLTGSPNKYVSPGGLLKSNEDADGNPLPPPPFADFTDWYYLPNADDMATNGFKEGDPPMLIKPLERSVSLFGGMKFMSYVMCIGKQERKGQKGKQDITVYPAKYGVNWTNGACNYTKKYCDHMSLSFRGGAGNTRPSCYMNKGQEVAEMLFGTTISREYIKWGNDIKKCASKNASASACANALMGPIVKTGVGLLSTTGKNMGNCVAGNVDACGKIFTAGVIAAPGKLLGGLGHGAAGLTSTIGGLIGDEAYTAFITAPFTAVGEMGDILADPLGAILHPLETAETILSMPADIWIGIADTLDTIPIVGEAIAFVIYALTDIYTAAVEQVLDMDDVTATWWCPACMGVKLVWKGFRAAFGITTPMTEQEKSDWWKAKCLGAQSTCENKWAGMEDTPPYEACRRIAATCPKINVNTYQKLGWGIPADETEKYTIENAGEDTTEK